MFQFLFGSDGEGEKGGVPGLTTATAVVRGEGGAAAGLSRPEQGNGGPIPAPAPKRATRGDAKNARRGVQVVRGWRTGEVIARARASIARAWNSSGCTPKKAAWRALAAMARRRRDTGSNVVRNEAVPVSMPQYSAWSPPSAWKASRVFSRKGWAVGTEALGGVLSATSAAALNANESAEES